MLVYTECKQKTVKLSNKYANYEQGCRGSRLAWEGGPTGKWSKRVNDQRE